LCVDELGLLVKELSFELLVSTPASGKVLTSTVCFECPIIVHISQLSTLEEIPAFLAKAAFMQCKQAFVMRQPIPEHLFSQERTFKCIHQNKLSNQCIYLLNNSNKG